MKYITTFVFLFCFLGSFAQNKVLTVRHKSYFKRELFYLNDPIYFSLKQDKTPLSGRISALTDSAMTIHYSIVLDDNEGYERQEYEATILLSDISAIRVKEHKRKFSITTRQIAGYVGGFGLFMVGQSVYTWIRDKDPHFRYMITGAGIFSLAQIPHLAKRKKYVIGKKWRLSVNEF